MNTIAVGPREEVAFWVTGGTGIVRPRVCGGNDTEDDVGVDLEMALFEASFVSCLMGVQKTILLEK